MEKKKFNLLRWWRDDVPAKDRTQLIILGTGILILLLIAIIK
jgi:hypothetical protein